MSARRHRVRERLDPRPGTRRCYLESSALLSGLLEDDTRIIKSIHPPDTVMSALTLAESRRAVQRAGVAGRIDDATLQAALATIAQLERECTILEISDVILARVGRRFPAEPVRTLDAIHLASAEQIDDPAAPVTLLTRDRRIAENAVMLGMRVG